MHNNYLDYYRDIDPLHPRHYIDSNKVIVTDLDVGQRLSTKREEYINDFLKPYGFNHIMEIFIRHGSDIIAGLSLLRTRSDNPFTHDEAAVIAQAREYVEFNLKQLYNNQYKALRETEHLTKTLTRQEVRIFKLLCNGASNKIISKTLFIELSTVKTHLRHVYSKLNVANRRDLLALVLNQNKTAINTNKKC